MGLLDQVLGGFLGGGQQGQSAPVPQSPQASSQFPGSNLSPMAKAVLMVLAAKAWQHYSAQRANAGAAQPGGIAPVDPTQANSGLGGLLGGLGGGLGGLLAGLGGAGALGGLLNRFNQAGLGDQAQSWVGTGQNQPIAPHQLEQALGGDTLDELSRQFQMPRDQLMSELSTELPQGIDRITPQGRLPNEHEISQL